jgi:hypothetical protein
MVATWPLVHNGWYVSPAGFFPSTGHRRALAGANLRDSEPLETLLRSAIGQGGNVHVWFHPTI